jgi:lipooligosaccharide transport system ATP-binding protein
MSHGTAVAVGPPGELIERHAGREVEEVYGPQARLRDVEALAREAGLATRRTGTSVALLRAEELAGRNGASLPEGHRRAATLEDVFVHLTGEEIA